MKAKYTFLWLVFDLILTGVSYARTPAHVLPLGDSITKGSGTYPSYRYYLEQSLNEVNFDFGYIGTLNGAGTNNGTTR